MSKQVSTRMHAAAVALGRLGGLKGGLARMALLSPSERSALGRKGMAARWGKRRKARRGKR